MTIPVEWILGVLIGLGSVIATLAGLLWRTMNNRLEAQDRIISNLQTEVSRLSKGCGMESCIWRRMI
jgi:hypothetical protein